MSVVVLSATVLVPEAAQSKSLTQSELARTFADDRSIHPHIRRAYLTRNNQPIWTGEDPRPILALLVALRSLPGQGLPSMATEAATIEGFFASDPEFWRTPTVELYLTDIYLQLARNIRTGVVEPRAVDENILVDRLQRTDFEMLAPLMSAQRVESHLRSLAPVATEYLRLQDKLARMQTLVARGGWGKSVIEEGALLRPGARDMRVPTIRQRLTLMGDHPPLSQPITDPSQPVLVTYASELVYDTQLYAAVRSFQRRHGLNDDGIIGDATLAAMNVPAEERLKQVMVNLERLRWETQARAPRHIYVNLPDYRLRVYEGGEPVFETRVVIGGAGDDVTPEFSDMMTFLVANPTWTVPRSIAVEELLPQLQTNPDFLADNDMTLIRGGSEPIPEDVRSIDWFRFHEDFFPFWLRQGPGPFNALGRVKFMFPNEHAIYLHDTPQRGLFRNDIRDASHGCIRVEDPIGLAELLLTPNYSEETVQQEFAQVLATGDETELPLKRMIPIHLDYRTSWVEADGTLHFRQDVYGRDAAVFAAMEAKGVELLGS
ncbi:MAG: L,D-transpeptidase family protein [Pseudomonadota bacterium]